MLIGLFVGQAHAFCGAYVGGADADLTNGASQMAIVRQGDRTVLTLLNDVQGAEADFGLLIPIPMGISEDDVRVVDASVLSELDRYSSPRLVEYTCDNLYDTGLVSQPSANATSQGCSGAAVGDDAESAEFERALVSSELGLNSADVFVEDVFTVGDYDATVLKALSDEGLDWWLDKHGFEVDGPTEDVLSDYVDEGSWFLALKVSTDLEGDAEAEDTGLITEEPEDAWLPALQIEYTSDSFTLPIRLGTASSEGEQDLVLYIVTAYADGQVHVSNYDEAFVEDECLVSEVEGFGIWYGEQFPTEASWTVEFGWGAGKCDPCPDDVVSGLSDDMVQAVGFGGGALDAYFTRLHLRYTPESITQDLSLYASGITSTTQQRYIVHDRTMEASWPICGEGWAESPGSCDIDTSVRSGGLGEGDQASAQEASGSGCAALGLTPLMGLALLAGAVRRRYAHRA